MEDFQTFKGIEVTNNQGDTDYSLELLKRDGFFIQESVFSENELSELRKGMDSLWESQLDKYGVDLLKKIGDFGVIRAMMDENPLFFSTITHPQILKWVDLIVGDTAILHLQNGIALFPTEKHNQANYHKDFPKDFLSSKVLSLNVFIAIDEFTSENGGTWVLPGSHLFSNLPSQEYIARNQQQINCPAGSLIVFDSTLWHKGGDNLTSAVRRGINNQFTRPFIKQQLDYPVIFNGKVDIESKLAQKLGMWTIPPKSIDQYRVTDPSLRTYRGGQG